MSATAAATVSLNLQDGVIVVEFAEPTTVARFPVAHFKRIAAALLLEEAKGAKEIIETSRILRV